MDGLAAVTAPQHDGIMSLVEAGRHLLGYTYSGYGLLRKMAGTACSTNCSGHGQCLNGSCYCMIQYQVVLQKVPSELHPKVRNHGEGPY